MLATSVLYIHTSNNFATFGIYSTSGWWSGQKSPWTKSKIGNWLIGGTDQLKTILWCRNVCGKGTYDSLDMKEVKWIGPNQWVSTSSSRPCLWMGLLPLHWCCQNIFCPKEDDVASCCRHWESTVGCAPCSSFFCPSHQPTVSLHFKTNTSLEKGAT